MKRFYRAVGVVPEAPGWQVALDGRKVRTAGGRPQIVPSLPLAEALGAEWASQGETIDRNTLVRRDLADYAIDIVATGRSEVERGILAFGESDTLCYRADPDEPLWAHQQQHWEPLLQAAEQRWDIGFASICGIIHRPQPPATLERLGEAVAALDNFSLAALNTLASLTASLVLGLAALEPDADVPVLWAAAQLEEEWQAQLWGHDEEAAARNHHRFTLFATAAEFARLAVVT